MIPTIFGEKIEIKSSGVTLDKGHNKKYHKQTCNLLPRIKKGHNTI